MGRGSNVSIVPMSGDAVVIFGGGEGQLPAIVGAHNLHLKAIVLDPNPNCPAAALADQFICVDLSNETEAFRALDGWASAIKGTITLAADFPVPLLAKVNERYSLPGVCHNVAFACTNKCKMRRCLMNESIRCPQWFAVESTEAALDACQKLRANGIREAVFKPLDSSGGRGITAISLDGSSTDAEAAAAYDRARKFNRKSSMAGTVMVEEFIDGDEVSVETLSLGVRDALVVAVTQKSTTGPPHFVEVGHSQPCDLPILVDAETAIRNAALGAVAALGMTYCAGHVEIKVRRRTDDSNQVEAVVMEAACRLGGGCIPRLTAKTTGVDMVRETIRIVTGTIRRFDDVLSTLAKRPDQVDGMAQAAAVQMLFFRTTDSVASETRVVKKVAGLTAAMRRVGTFHVLATCKPGGRVRSLIDDSCRFGFVCTEGTTPEEARLRALAAREAICVELAPEKVEEQGQMAGESAVLGGTDPHSAYADGAMIPIFDSLAHPTLSGTYLGQVHDASFGTLRESMNAHGILGVCAMTISAVGEHYDARAFAHQCRRLSEPPIYPVAMIEPAWCRDELRILKSKFEDLVRMGYRAVKIHPRFLGQNTNWDKLLDLVRGAAAAKLVIFLCTWWHDSATAMPTTNPFFDIIRMASTEPGTKMILMHGGGSDVLRYAELVKANPNLLLDVSCTICRYEGVMDAELRYLMTYCDQRMCIGSDFPEFSQERLRQRFETLSVGLPLEKRCNVAFRSLATFLQLPITTCASGSSHRLLLPQVAGNISSVDGESTLDAANDSSVNGKPVLTANNDSAYVLTDGAVDTIRERYRARLQQHGSSSAKSLGWAKGGQDLRFKALTHTFDLTGKSLLDIGCGFGDLLKYVPMIEGTQYMGIDIMPEFIDVARDRVAASDPRQISFEMAEFLDMELSDDAFDFAVGSGLFNRKLGHGHSEYDFIEAVLCKAYRVCKRGFAFDFMSTKVLTLSRVEPPCSCPASPVLFLPATLSAPFLFPPGRLHGRGLAPLRPEKDYGDCFPPDQAHSSVPPHAVRVRANRP